MRPLCSALLVCFGILLAASACRAGEEPAKPLFTFAVVSDTHLSHGGKAATEWLAQAVAEINASPAEFTLALGDLVENGAKHEAFYPEWVSTAKSLKNPFYAIPGNHDSKEFFTKYIRPETDYAFDHKGYRFVLFNDAEPTSHDGVVTPAQIQWLSAQVEGAAAKKLRVILCAHITAHPNQAPDIAWFVHEGGKELDALLRAKSDTIVAFLSGHFHYGLRGWDDRAGVIELVMPSLAFNSPRRLDGAPGFQLDEFRRGYVLVDVYEAKLGLTYKPLGAEAKARRMLEMKRVTGQVPP